MAYRVLSKHEHLFTCSKRGVRKGCALEATGLANRKTAQEAAEEAAKCAAFAPQGRAANGVAASHPIPWIRGFNVSAPGLVYYNYRHDNPVDGRWTGRDPLLEEGSRMLYLYDKPVTENDALGRRKGSEHDRLSE